MMTNLCSIGKFESSECHELVHTHGKVGLLPFVDLSKEECELIVWRTGIRVKNLKTICFHHRKLYLEKFSVLNKYCCHPFGRHVEKKYFKGKG